MTDVKFAAIPESERPAPRFAETFCSQCGKSLGPGNHGASHCHNHTPYDRESMIDRIEEAMTDVHDMDTTWAQFSAAAYDAMAWIKYSEEVPPRGQHLLATDGESRWLDVAFDAYPSVWRFIPGKQIVATHWHPIPQLPAKKSPATTTDSGQPETADGDKS